MMNEAAVTGGILKQKRIRPIAICIVRRGDSIFVAEGVDVVKGQTFYRPLGGSIEFGETGAEAVAREFQEELGEEVTNLRYLCALENIFTYNGDQGHEIVLVYEGDFANPELYGRDWVEAVEDNGAPFRALWMPFVDFGPERPLYPDGISELLSDQAWATMKETAEANGLQQGE
jgi:8-oxo-dGTP pyrophosphatase MutT (NUDIX family)